MAVALKQANVITEVGPGGVLHSLFSTIAVRLEGGSWGGRFPHITGRLYGGRLKRREADAALREMRVIKKELSELPPTAVVWDADDPSLDPPWGRSVAEHVRSMAQYHVTTTGRNLVDEIIDNLESLRDYGGTLDIISYDDRALPPLT